MYISQIILPVVLFALWKFGLVRVIFSTSISRECIQILHTQRFITIFFIIWLLLFFFTFRISLLKFHFMIHRGIVYIRRLCVCLCVFIRIRFFLFVGHSSADIFYGHMPTQHNVAISIALKCMNSSRKYLRHWIVRWLIHEFINLMQWLCWMHLENWVSSGQKHSSVFFVCFFLIQLNLHDRKNEFC